MGECEERAGESTLWNGGGGGCWLVVSDYQNQNSGTFVDAGWLLIMHSSDVLYVGM